ncbi:MAG: YggS family pyridoxal phosphate-dependent enzyme [Deltaproteobacteria bacterium]|nr:YggS family pyridoxal phosphate-dependent enzyme [Deltaproteobacteria bacterium]
MQQKLDYIKTRIREAAASCGRDPKSIRLVAVGKTKPAELVRQAITAGAAIIGENYIQEAREKFKALGDCTVSWHYIGHLQSNKAKYAVRIFDLIHSVDSLKLAGELDKHAQKIDKIQPILIQVNISKETTKGGVHEAQTLELVRAVSQFTNLSIKGLMTMPPYFDDPDRARPFFKALGDLRQQIRLARIPNVSMDELSMGMSGDFEAAIEEGATLVRVGTAIFGARQ